MTSLLVVLFPIALLLFLLGMDRVEAPLRRNGDAAEVERFLDSAKQEDVDEIISGGLRAAMDRWRSRRFGGLLPGTSRKSRKRRHAIVKSAPPLLSDDDADLSDNR
ncbi:MAG: hypothetical protein ABI137_13680 [Antricoccus sp.]